jgi:GTPase
MISGNIDGIRNSVLDRLEKLYEVKLAKESLFNEEISEILCEITFEINREISISIDRRGKILEIFIGDSSTVEMPLIDISAKKLSGIRIIHTHPNGVSNLSALDISALIKLKLDCIVAIGVDVGKCKDVCLGFCSVYNDLLSNEIISHISLSEALNFNFLDKVNYVEHIIKYDDVIEDDSEKAILVGIEDEESLIELEELTKACNVLTIEKVFQKRNKIDSATYIGKGKAEELALIRQAVRANVIIFDDELSGSQVRNLEDLTGVKVIDRTTLILEIFAKRAKTREAKVQVELAQLKYRLPRLIGLGTLLSRTGGGIGTKGPGEKKLEIDRRRIKERIHDLQDELLKLQKIRGTQREKRSELPKISIVGYTNAGKSTLRNVICEIAAPAENSQKEKIFEADMLFATLDTTTRAVILPDNRVAALTDTVGFINKLPHDLVESFKSTLEEVVYSDLLLHVVDVSSENAISQISTVEDVLLQIGAKDKKQIIVLNKIDKADEKSIEAIKKVCDGIATVEISAKNILNIDKLLEMIGFMLPNKYRRVNYLIPYGEQSVVAYLHRNSKIIHEEYKDEGTFITVEVDGEVYNKLENYLWKSL